MTIALQKLHANSQSASSATASGNHSSTAHHAPSKIRPVMAKPRGVVAGIREYIPVVIAGKPWREIET